MKKNTKIIVWSVVGLAVATGAFFGIRAMIKKSKATKKANELPPVDTKKDTTDSLLTQEQADGIVSRINTTNSINANLGYSDFRAKTVKDLKDQLKKGGYYIVDGKAVKIAE